jgi:hypothetical protein
VWCSGGTLSIGPVPGLEVRQCTIGGVLCCGGTLGAAFVHITGPPAGQALLPQKNTRDCREGELAMAMPRSGS